MLYCHSSAAYAVECQHLKVCAMPLHQQQRVVSKITPGKAEKIKRKHDEDSGEDSDVPLSARYLSNPLLQFILWISILVLTKSYAAYLQLFYYAFIWILLERVTLCSQTMKSTFYHINGKHFCFIILSLSYRIQQVKKSKKETPESGKKRKHDDDDDFSLKVTCRRNKS